ncbi:MAG: hypothetical protein KAR37_10080 [Alphaproteobacteria bacterium]|nr:hypothetical protein [Alphaproteobacteria bacterium]
MRRMFLAVGAAVVMVASIVPALAQDRPVTGKEAVEIVSKGTIRASSSEGFQGFLLLIEYQGRNYTCAVNATGQVQECFPLYW